VTPGYDPYQILGVGHGVGVDQIRSAHRLRARLAHPDFGGSAAKLAEVNVAFEVLSNGARRAAYDRFYANPSDPQLAQAWHEAKTAAERDASGRPAESFGAELDQMANRLEASPGVRFAGGAIVGLVIGAGIGALAGWYTELPLAVAAGIGGGVGLIGGGWAGATSKSA